MIWVACFMADLPESPVVILQVLIILWWGTQIQYYTLQTTGMTIGTLFIINSAVGETGNVRSVSSVMNMISNYYAVHTLTGLLHTDMTSRLSYCYKL